MISNSSSKYSTSKYPGASSFSDPKRASPRPGTSAVNSFRRLPGHVKSTDSGGRPSTLRPRSSIGCSSNPSNDSPTLLDFPDLDEARVDTLARRSEGGDIDGGSRDWARGMKSMMLIATGGFRMSWYMALGAGFYVRTFVARVPKCTFFADQRKFRNGE